jgi:hypothetical protein
MALNAPFSPVYGSGTLQGTTAVAALVAVGAGNKSLVLTNTGAVVEYVRVGDSSVVAVAYTDYPVPPYSQVVISKAPQFTHLSVVSPAGAGFLHVIAGEGE